MKSINKILPSNLNFIKYLIKYQNLLSTIQTYY